MAEKAKATRPVFNVAQSVDAYGLVCEQMRELEKKRDALKKNILANIESSATGEEFTLTIVNSIRESLDIKAIKEIMPQSWIEEFTRTSDVTTVNTRRIASAD